MRTTARAMLVLLALLCLVRASIYLWYVHSIIHLPFETHLQEGKMIFLSWRAQTGQDLYPDWRKGPYESNFFGPLYFLLVGELGKAFQSSLDGLFPIGRWLSFLSTVATSLLLAFHLWRRQGRMAGTLGAIASLGGYPLVGFSVMARPDLLAEFLGFAGFLGAIGSSRGAQSLGVLFLVAAIFTKQTTILFLAGAALGLFLSNRKSDAAVISVVVTSLCAGLIFLGTAFWQREFVSSLLGESASPFLFSAWKTTFLRIGGTCPDLLLFSLIGVFLWSRQEDRNWYWAALTFSILAGAAVGIAKQGSDVNYVVSLRLVEGACLATMCRRMSGDAGPSFKWMAVILFAIVLLAWSNLYQATALVKTLQFDRFLASPRGAEILQIQEQNRAMARDPGISIFTDSALIALRQGKRAWFLDAYLFRIMVDGGRIDPKALAERLERREFDLVILTNDVNAPDYDRYDFGLPSSLAALVRKGYSFAEIRGDLFFFVRKEDQPQ